jgi:ParB family chromosome partitioning protein
MTTQHDQETMREVNTEMVTAQTNGKQTLLDTEAISIAGTDRQLAKLRRGQVHPDPDQPRKEFGQKSLMELADSWRSIGQQVPIIVWPYPGQPGDYVIGDGERRWRCMPFVPCEEIEAVIVSGPRDPGQMLLIQMSLGLTNQRLNAIDAGEGFVRLMGHFALTPGELAERVGTSEGNVSKVLRVFNNIAEGLHADVRSGVLPFTIAYHIARLKDQAKQVELAEKVKQGLLKRQAVEREVNRLLGARPKKAKPVKASTARGLTAVIPAMEFDAVLAELAALAEAVRKAQKNNLPLSSVPSLLKS